MKNKTILIVATTLLLSIALFILIQFNNSTKKYTKTRKCNKLNHEIIDQHCKEYEYYSWQLNDSIHHYLEKSYLSGIKKTLSQPNEIEIFIKKGILKPIENNNFYVVDSLKYSYPFLIPTAKNLLNEIAETFQIKLHNTNLKGIRLIVTSVLRTSTTIKKLRRKNKNAIRYSAHLHGTTFDIDYSEFNHKKKITPSEKEILRDLLAKTLFDLRKNEKCWVTFEKCQSCFHIVSREKA